MYKIKIERDSRYAGYYDTFTVEPDETSVLITHEAEGFMNKDVKPKTITMLLKDYTPINNVFENINFSKILEESDILNGYDGWILKCTVSNGMTEVTVSLWCPEEDPSKPETTKLLKACNKVCDLFPEMIINMPHSYTEEEEQIYDEIMKELQEDAEKKQQNS